MGIAAYNRGSQVIEARTSAEARPVEFEVMDLLNGLPKYEDAGRAFGEIVFPAHNSGFWAECAETGFGFWYPTLHEAVKRWKVQIVRFENGCFVGVPA